MLSNNFFRTSEEISIRPASLYRDLSRSYREKSTLPEDLSRPQILPNILLVDDDPIFGNLMSRAAKKSGAHLTFCKSITELTHLNKLNFDVAVIDYDLGNMNGVELTKNFESSLSHHMPVILISQKECKPSHQWPESMREFVHKIFGPFAILTAAFEAYEVEKIHQYMKQKKKITRCEGFS